MAGWLARSAFPVVRRSLEFDEDRCLGAGRSAIYSAFVRLTGNGLTACKRLAESMDGSMSFNPRAGGGTNFVLDLPRAEFEGD